MEKPPRNYSINHYIFKWVQEHFELILLTFLIILGWSIRVILAINTGGMVHPDEVYQSLEVAHKMKYGYADTPWEFNVPQNPGDEGAMRSYLYPLLFYLIFELCDLIGIPYGTEGILRVVRIFSATWSTLLIPIVFFLSKELFPPQDKSSIFSLFAAFLTTVWFEFLFYGIRTINNSFVTIPIFLAVYLHLIASKGEFPTTKTIGLEISAGALLGLSCALRMDSFIFFIPFFIFRYQNSSKMIHLYSLLILGFIGSFFIQGISDLFFYGTFLISPLQWLKFNVIEGESSRFGTEPVVYYIQELSDHFFYILSFAIIFGILAIKVRTALLHNKGKMENPWFFTILELLIWFLVPLGIFSLVEHKEPRFIFSLYPIAMILFAATMKECFEILQGFYYYLHSNILQKININRVMKRKELIIIQMVLLLVSCVFVTQMSAIDASERDWNYSHDINQAYEWVGNQENSTGLIVFEYGWNAGGRTYLHKNIPMECFPDPEEDQNWKNLSSIFNYLITPQYQYERYKDLENQIEVNFTKIKTIEDQVDIWHLKEFEYKDKKKENMDISDLENTKCNVVSNKPSKNWRKESFRTLDLFVLRF